jgi:hypothetical protein
VHCASASSQCPPCSAGMHTIHSRECVLWLC